MSRFAPAPDKPNCVSSRAPASDAQHAISPLAASLDEVRKAVADVPRAKLVEESPGYLHYVVTTRWFRFEDDVEFEAEGDVVHVRSASRVGYSDMGVNRRRVEKLRTALR